MEGAYCDLELTRRMGVTVVVDPDLPTWIRGGLIADFAAYVADQEEDVD